jgi:hypothetical protein
MIEEVPFLKKFSRWDKADPQNLGKDAAKNLGTVFGDSSKTGFFAKGRELESTTTNHFYTELERKRFANFSSPFFFRKSIVKNYKKIRFAKSKKINLVIKKSVWKKKRITMYLYRISIAPILNQRFRNLRLGPPGC